MQTLPEDLPPSLRLARAGWPVLLVLGLLALIPLPLEGSGNPSGEGGPAPFPHRVLLTDDNGIDDPKLVALARAFAPIAETWVFAPAAERSGTSNFLTIVSEGRIQFTPRDLGPNIRAFAVEGYPADCVAVALLGPLSENPPDLVVSGINNGDNAGAGWMFSGTVGAARTAAFLGVPAIAVSGLDDDIPGAVDAAVDWVVRLASAVGAEIDPPRYLTVSLPRTSPENIRGIRVTSRSPLMELPALTRVEEGVWAVEGTRHLAPELSADSDVPWLQRTFIAIVPMVADEVDGELLDAWVGGGLGLPRWRASPP